MSKITRIIAKILLVVVLATQVFGGLFSFIQIQSAEAALKFNFKTAFKQAKIAELTSVPGVQRWDWHRFTDNFYENMMIGIAYAFAQYFMQRFVNKLTEKYKIRNFLYYDQILTNYYLTNFIRDKIHDPDLRQIYVLLESAYVTGQPTYTTPGTGPDPKKALIPRFKKAVADLYKKQTGIDVKYIANPPANADVDNYLAQSRFYYLNNPGYTETNLRAQFGEFQSAATTASQLEVIVGNSLKAGRYVGGTCEKAKPAFESDGDNSDVSTLAGCKASGGEWNESAVDTARSFIDNPTAYVESYMQGFIKENVNTNFNPNNFWFVMGNAVGKFLINKLLVDKSNGVLNEDPRGYVPMSNTEGQSASGEVGANDLDGDGIPDGYDVDGDGILDTCIYGGTAPACTGSRSVASVGGTGECSYLMVGGATDLQEDLAGAMEAVLPDFENVLADESGIEDFKNSLVDWLNNNGYEATRGHNGNCNASANNLAIRIGSTDQAEMYEVARDGEMCPENGSGLGMIPDHVVPCRPTDGYSSPWNYQLTGQR